jgi:hypothetical protein
MFGLSNFPYVGSGSSCVSVPVLVFMSGFPSFPYAGSDSPCVALYVWLVKLSVCRFWQVLCSFVCLICQAFRM